MFTAPSGRVASLTAPGPPVRVQAELGPDAHDFDYYFSCVLDFVNELETLGVVQAPAS